MTDNETPIKKAVRIAGGQAELARRCSTSQPRIWQCVHRNLRVPADLVLSIEKATGGEVSRHDLRPDLYPSELIDSTPLPTQSGWHSRGDYACAETHSLERTTGADGTAPRPAQRRHQANRAGDQEREVGVQCRGLRHFPHRERLADIRTTAWLNAALPRRRDGPAPTLSSD